MDRVDHFLDNYINSLRDGDKSSIMDYHSFLLKFGNAPKIITSIYGKHLTSCPWSKDSARTGPDTCSCYYFNTYTEKLNKIMDWYEKNM